MIREKILKSEMFFFVQYQIQTYYEVRSENELKYEVFPFSGILLHAQIKCSYMVWSPVLKRIKTHDTIVDTSLHLSYTYTHMS